MFLGSIANVALSSGTLTLNNNSTAKKIATGGGNTTIAADNSNIGTLTTYKL